MVRILYRYWIVNVLHWLPFPLKLSPNDTRLLMSVTLPPLDRNRNRHHILLFAYSRRKGISKVHFESQLFEVVLQEL